MTEPVAAEFSADQFMALIDQIDGSIPRLKEFIAFVDRNPAMIAVATRFFPPVGAVIPMLVQIGPWLDFLQQLTDAIQAAKTQ